MAKLYSGSIDVTKIDKTKLFKGEKGTYLNVTIWVNDEINQHGQIGSIQVSQSKQERDAGNVPKVYLGNIKEIALNQGGNLSKEEKDDLPF